MIRPTDRRWMSLMVCSTAVLMSCWRDTSGPTDRGAPRFAVTPAAAGVPFLSVTPDGGTLAAASNSVGSYIFVVSYWQPFSSSPATFRLLCSSNGSVACTGLSAGGATLASGQSASTTASYLVSSGTGRLVLTACDGFFPPPADPCLGASFLDSGWVTINPPPTTAISGATSVDSPGTYTWTAQAGGGDGTYTYQWSYQPSGSVTWTTLGTATTQSRYVSSSTPPFRLRVAVTSASQSTTATISVSNSLWQPPCTRTPCPK